MNSIFLILSWIIFDKVIRLARTPTVDKIMSKVITLSIAILMYGYAFSQNFNNNFVFGDSAGLKTFLILYQLFLKLLSTHTKLVHLFLTLQGICCFIQMVKKFGIRSMKLCLMEIALKLVNYFSASLQV